MNGFEIISKLGDGSYSVVYKVRRKADSKIYALKKVKLKNLSEKEKQNALNEVRILASIKSTFVISYKEAFIDEAEQSLCIIMEYADKGDLYQKICYFRKNKCFFDEVDVWRIFIQMTRGLKSLHDLKILHRDLKSANIFLFSDGSVKIGDLNVSKVTKRGLGYTQTGTPYYASPEVWRDEPYDSKSDIWSLACVTYEMLALHPPFRAKNMEGLYNKVIRGRYQKVSEKYSSDISEILSLMFKIDPNKRPSCDDLLKNPIIIKRMEFFKSNSGNEQDLINIDESVLLQTIKISKNLIFLSNKLPKANYFSQSELNLNTTEDLKNIYNNTENNNNNLLLPSINNINNKNVNGIKSQNLKLLTESSSSKNEEIIRNQSKKSIVPSIKKNLITSSNKPLVNDNKSNNNILNQKYRKGDMKKRNGKLNKEISNINQLYISKDLNSKKVINNGNKNNLYLPDIDPKNNGNQKKNISNSNIVSRNISSKKKLNPLKIKH